MTGRTAGAGLGTGTEGFENCRDLLRTAVSPAMLSTEGPDFHRASKALGAGEHFSWIRQNTDSAPLLIVP